MWPLVMTYMKETGRLINRATIVIISPLDGETSVCDFNTCILALFRHGSKQQWDIGLPDNSLTFLPF